MVKVDFSDKNVLNSFLLEIFIREKCAWVISKR